MPKIPTGSFDIEKEAERLYDIDEVRSPLFEEAWKKYPRLSTSDRQLDLATDLIMDGFSEAFENDYSPEDWQNIHERLYESVVAGLT